MCIQVSKCIMSTLWRIGECYHILAVQMSIGVEKEQNLQKETWPNFKNIRTKKIKSLVERDHVLVTSKQIRVYVSLSGVCLL